MSRTSVLITLAVLILFTISGYFASNLFEKRYQTLPAKLKGEAAKNSLLAAGRFLNEMGIKTVHIKNYKQLFTLPDDNDVILISSDRRTLNKQQSQALLDWVNRGGTLIIGTIHKGDSERTIKSLLNHDQLMKLLELNLLKHGEDITDEEKLLNISAEDDKDLGIEINQEYIIIGGSEKDNTINNRWGTIILQRDHGRGHITVTTDLEIIQYKNIGQYDHARFLWHLVNRKGTVWLVSQNDMPPLWRWLWQRAPYVFLSLLLITIFWLWIGAQRFGPLQPVAEAKRRQILEHITASGFFLWKHKKQQQLIESVRDELQRYAGKRHPAWVGMSQQQQFEHLHECSGIDRKVIESLFGDKHNHQQQEFSQTIRLLKQIRKKL